MLKVGNRPNLPFALKSSEIFGDVATVQLGDTNEKAKPAERRRQKATGPRFLREAKEDSPKDP